MADSGGAQRELVFCHSCHNEWLRHQHGLQCPDCHCQIVEIIEEHSDPRHNHIDISDDDEDDVMGNNDDQLPHNPLHRHHPWRDPAPDPDEPDIEHVEWNPSAGIHFARTTIRQSGPGTRPRGQGDDLFAPILQSFSTLFEGAANAQGRPQGGTPARDGPRMLRPPFSTRNSPFPEHHHHIHHHHGNPWSEGWRDGPPGVRQVFTTTGQFQRGPMPNNQQGQNVTNVLAQLLHTMQASMADQRGQPPGITHFPAILAQMLGNGAHGDAVFSDEALDRIITQMMEQTNTNSAPGPASAAAIAGLPKVPADKNMMGQDGKAECSVCMDAVEIGDEVTVLPCKHWFHGECVGAWLKEHDTCPHCRQGIMPKDGPHDANAPRAPGETPRNVQNPFANLNRTNTGAGTPPSPAPGPGSADNIPPPMPGAFTQPGMQQPYVPGGYPRYPEPRNFVTPGHHSQPPSLSPQRPQNDRRRSSGRERSSNGGEGSSGGGHGGGGVTGWFRNLRGGSSR